MTTDIKPVAHVEIEHRSSLFRKEPSFTRLGFGLHHLYDQQAIDTLRAEVERLRKEVQRLTAFLRRYRDEVPLGHQPHMVAHEVDAAMAAQAKDPS